MHLLFVLPAYAPFIGGAQTFCHAIAQRLAADGHALTIATTNARQADDFWQPPPAGRAELPPRETIDGVQVIRLPLTYPWPAPYRFGVMRRVSHHLARWPLPATWRCPLLRHITRSMPPILGLQSELRPLIAAADLVLTIDAGWDGLFVGAAQAALFQARPLVAAPLIHTGSPAITAHFGMAHQTAVYRQAAATLALSAPEQALLARWGVAEHRLHCLPMGVDQVDTDAALCASENMRRRQGLPQRFVLFLGAATYDKGAFTLIQALAELAKRGKSVEIVYAGPQQHQLAVFIDTQPVDVRAILKKRTHLLGIVDEKTKQALLAGCTVLALPSRVDSFGIVVLEAWQHGKPVVAAAVGGPATLVAPEQTGLLVPFAEPVVLAAALQRILDESGLAARLGTAGRQVVTNQYTWDKCYDTLHQIFRRICGDADVQGAEHTKQYRSRRSDERL